MERINEKILRTVLAISVGAVLGMSRNVEPVNGSEGAVNNYFVQSYPMVEFAVLDFGQGGARIGYNWNFPSYVQHPTLMIGRRDEKTGMSYFLYFTPSCQRDPDPYYCYFNIPETEKWDEWTPAIQSLVAPSLVNKSVMWRMAANHSFVRNKEIHRIYMPLATK